MLINNLIRATKKYTDDPKEYHPEGCLYHHVGLVTARASLIGDRSLVCAAILHDLCKPSHGREHALAMAYLIETNDDVRYFIHNLGGKIDVVHQLVLRHMDKQVTRKNKHIPFMDTFFVIDDMINRHDIPTLIRTITLPCGTTFRNAEVYFMGMSPLQIARSIPEFTITVNRTPFTYPLSKSDWILKTII